MKKAVARVLALSALVACTPKSHPQLRALLLRPAVSQFIRALPELAVASLRKAQLALGVDAKDVSSIPFVFAAAAMPGDPGRCRGFWRHGIARAVTSSRGAARRHHIVLCLDKIPPRPDMLRGVLTHEISHVVLSRALGGHTRNLPRCLNEGIADHIAGKGHSRILRWIAASLRKTRAPPKLIGFAALADDPGTPRSYAECGVHTRFLLERAGAGALTRLMQTLAGGASFWDAARQLTGLARDDYVRASDAWAERTLTELLATLRAQ